MKGRAKHKSPLSAPLSSKLTASPRDRRRCVRLDAAVVGPDSPIAHQRPPYCYPPATRRSFRVAPNSRNIDEMGVSSRFSELNFDMRQSGASDATPPGAANGNSKAIRLLIAKSALVPDCAEVLIDAKHDEHKLGRNARHHNAHDGAEDAGDEKYQADKWIIGHRCQRTDNACESEQDGNHNGQPIKDLDHSGRDKSLPLEQITKAEHKASRSPAPPVGLADCTARLRWSIAAGCTRTAACAFGWCAETALRTPCFVDGPRWDI